MSPPDDDQDYYAYCTLGFLLKVCYFLPEAKPVAKNKKNWFRNCHLKRGCMQLLTIGGSEFSHISDGWLLIVCVEAAPLMFCFCPCFLDRWLVIWLYIEIQTASWCNSSQPSGRLTHWSHCVCPGSAESVLRMGCVFLCTKWIQKRLLTIISTITPQSTHLFVQVFVVRGKHHIALSNHSTFSALFK